MATMTTLRERCFSPCKEHSPADWAGRTVSREDVAYFLKTLCFSPTVRDCPACKAATLAEARRYAESMASKKVDGWKITDAPWWWQRYEAERIRQVGRSYTTNHYRPLEVVARERLKSWKDAAKDERGA